MQIGDQVTAVNANAAQTLIIEGTIRAFRYEGLQALIETANGEQHWCNTSSLEAVTS